MSGIGMHSVYGGGFLAVAMATQVVSPPTLAESAWFFFGTGAVDLTSTLMRFGFPKDKPAPNSWNENDWDESLYEYVENNSPWAWPYIFTHSLYGSLLILWLLYQNIGSELVLWYGLGHLTHIVLDEVTHKRSYLFWPFGIRIPSENWYEDTFAKTNIAFVWERSVPIATIGWHAWWDDWGIVVIGWFFSISSLVY